jgi:hypothetical protein
MMVPATGCVGEGAIVVARLEGPSLPAPAAAAFIVTI